MDRHHPTDNTSIIHTLSKNDDAKIEKYTWWEFDVLEFLYTHYTHVCPFWNEQVIGTYCHEERVFHVMRHHLLGELSLFRVTLPVSSRNLLPPNDWYLLWDASDSVVDRQLFGRSGRRHANGPGRGKSE